MTGAFIELHRKFAEYLADNTPEGAQISRASQPSLAPKQEEEESQPSAILVVTLLPLTPSQVEHYASAKGVKNPQEFIAALEEGNAWAFAGRPLDVEFLYAYWNDKGYLGNLTELSEYMISKLLAEVPNREKLDVLTPGQAREGAESLAAAAVFCRRLKFRVAGWQQFPPPLPHEKQERNSIDNRLFVGLTGLQTLWRSGRLDFEGLSADELDLLVRYACNELNGFPEWFTSLMEARPEDASRVLEKAVAGEWNYPAEMEHVHDVVAKLAWMPDPAPVLARIVMGRLLVGDPLNPRMLEYAFAVIVRSSENAATALCDIAKTRVVTYTVEQPQWFSWMNIWLQLDALAALDYLESVLSESGENADDLVIRLCGVMYGRHDEQRQISNPSYLKPKALARLIPLVHRHVREAEDIHRSGQGAYSPGPRDHAQRFRSRLLETLGASKEPEADAVLWALLHVPTLSASKDWILHLLDGRKYLLVDDAPWQPEDVPVFATQYRSEPRSDYQLFRLIVRLLTDIKNHVERSENAANRLWVRKGDQEEKFRGGLLDKISELSLDWFNVVQEKEVDQRQRPDLCVERPGLNSLPIEVKLADSWTIPVLLERLENQLVGQYLRPANIRHGIYVLGNAGTKKSWEMPGTGERINFQALVPLIRERAASLQIERRADVDGIEVIGIDFPDPRER